MASPPPRSSFSLHSLLQGFLALFAARPPVRDGGASTYDDAFLSAAATRRDEEDSNQPVGHVVKTCEQGGSQQKHSHDEPPPPGVIMDSGAPCHVAGDKSSFLPSSFKTVTGAAATYYRARDGRQLAVAGVGTVSWGSFELPGVLYVPDLAGVVLVSVPQLAERGYLVAFGGEQCYVQDRSTGNMIVGKGRLHGGAAVLYYLDYLMIRPGPGTTDSMAAP